MVRAANVLPAKNAEYVNELLQALRHVWNANTSSNADTWSADRPETGQCAVTSLIVQDLLGGELTRAVVNGDSHYWVTLDRETIDITRSQFDMPLDMSTPETRSREYVLSHEATRLRYEELKSALAIELWAERYAKLVV